MNTSWNLISLLDPELNFQKEEIRKELGRFHGGKKEENWFLIYKDGGGQHIGGEGIVTDTTKRSQEIVKCTQKRDGILIYKTKSLYKLQIGKMRHFMPLRSSILVTQDKCARVEPVRIYLWTVTPLSGTIATHWLFKVKCLPRKLN